MKVEFGNSDENIGLRQIGHSVVKNLSFIIRVNSKTVILKLNSLIEKDFRNYSENNFLPALQCSCTWVETINPS